MKTDRLGPEQINLLRCVRRLNVALYQEQGRWYHLCGDCGRRTYHNRERCMSLYLRGFLMTGGTEEGAAFAGGSRTAYHLTEKGKAAR